MALEITSVNQFLSSFPPLNLRQTLRIISLTITLNMRTVNIILIMLFTVMRVFLTNPFAKRCRAMNIPFGQTKNKEEEEKTRGEKEGGNLTTTKNN